VLWSGESDPLQTGLVLHGSASRAVDPRGQPYSVQADDQGVRLTLPDATAAYPGDPPDEHCIGGAPVIVFESGVDPAIEVVPPRIA
jgi:hypothetical protein